MLSRLYSNFLLFKAQSDFIKTLIYGRERKWENSPISQDIWRSIVRLITVLVIIFISCCGLVINNIIFVSLNLRVPSKHEILAFRLLNLANSTLNPLVYAFLKDDIKRESKALLCRKRKLKLRPFQVHPEWQTAWRIPSNNEDHKIGNERNTTNEVCQIGLILTLIMV